MHGAGLLAFVILVGATTSACQQGVGPRAHPPPPDLTDRVLPKPPGSDDFAHRSFGHPLSLQDAEAVLRHTRVFEIGGMPPKRQIQAFVFARLPRASRQQESSTALRRFYCLIPPRPSR